MGSIFMTEGFAVSKALAQKFVELSDVLCDEGYDDVGQLLKGLCHSPNCILSLRNALLQTAGLSQETTNDLAISQAGGPQPRPASCSEESWLSSFVSTSGDLLTDEQQGRLLRLFRQWASGSGVDRVKADALSWCNDPLNFCETTPRRHMSSISEPIGFYFDEYEYIENTPNRNRPRRRAMLLETFLAIDKEERQLRRKQKEEDQFLRNAKNRQRVTKYRSHAVESIASRLWGSRFSPEELKRRTKRLQRMARYGEKWSLIKPKGMLLALGGESQFFEQTGWEEVEIEAMNRYVKQMPVFSIQPTLETAIGAITLEWSRWVQAHVQQNTTLPVAISDHTELMYMQPHSEISSLSTARSPAGIQALLDACIGEEYRTTADAATLPDPTSQTVGMPQLGSEDFYFAENMDSRQYNMQDFERVPVRYTQDFDPIQSPFRRLPSAVTATGA